MLKFKSIIIAIAVLGVTFTAAGCGSAKGSGNSSTEGTSSAGEQRTAVYKKITPAEAKTMMDSGARYVLLDVRTQEEYDQGHIEGAILIPYDQIKDRAGAELPDKGALIFVYCRSGVRSAAASNTLVSMGYNNVYDIGGISGWPYGTTKG